MCWKKLIRVILNLCINLITWFFFFFKPYKDFFFKNYISLKNYIFDLIGDIKYLLNLFYLIDSLPFFFLFLFYLFLIFFYYIYFFFACVFWSVIFFIDFVIYLLFVKGDMNLKSNISDYFYEYNLILFTYQQIYLLPRIYSFKLFYHFLSFFFNTDVKKNENTNLPALFIFFFFINFPLKFFIKFFTGFSYLAVKNSLILLLITKSLLNCTNFFSFFNSFLDAVSFNFYHFYWEEVNDYRIIFLPDKIIFNPGGQHMQDAYDFALRINKKLIFIPVQIKSDDILHIGFKIPIFTEKKLFFLYSNNTTSLNFFKFLKDDYYVIKNTPGIKKALVDYTSPVYKIPNETDFNFNNISKKNFNSLNSSNIRSNLVKSLILNRNNFIPYLNENFLVLDFKKETFLEFAQKNRTMNPVLFTFSDFFLKNPKYQNDLKNDFDSFFKKKTDIFKNLSFEQKDEDENNGF